jgi:hypothetical protein
VCGEPARQGRGRHLEGARAAQGQALDEREVPRNEKNPESGSDQHPPEDGSAHDVLRAGARAAKAKMPPSGYLKNIYYDDMIYRLDTIKYLIGLAGVDHIMVGTDYPYDLGDWDAAKKVEELDVSEADKLLMLEGNAKRLLII